MALNCTTKAKRESDSDPDLKDADCTKLRYNRAMPVHD